MIQNDKKPFLKLGQKCHETKMHCKILISELGKIVVEIIENTDSVVKAIR